LFATSIFGEYLLHKERQSDLGRVDPVAAFNVVVRKFGKCRFDRRVVENFLEQELIGIKQLLNLISNRFQRQCRFVFLVNLAGGFCATRTVDFWWLLGSRRNGLRRYDHA